VKPAHSAGVPTLSIGTAAHGGREPDATGPCGREIETPLASMNGPWVLEGTPRTRGHVAVSRRRWCPPGPDREPSGSVVTTWPTRLRAATPYLLPG
jgi:hypothetical protein